MSQKENQVWAWLKYMDYPPGMTDEKMSEMALELIAEKNALLAGGKVKCNAGHESPRGLWNCPICTDHLGGENEKFKEVFESFVKLEVTDSLDEMKCVVESIKSLSKEVLSGVRVS